LEQQETALKSQLSDAQRLADDAEQQVITLQDRLTAAVSRTADLETKVSENNSVLEAEQRETSRLQAELTAAESARLDLSQQIDQLNAQLSGAQSTKTALGQQIEDLRSQVSFLQSLVSPGTAETQSLAKTISQARPAIVRIQASAGEGSGFLFAKEGYILTNAHVVGSAQTVTVIVDDSWSVTGQVMGRNEVMDVAVVKVSLGRDATFLTLGDSDTAEAGNEVLTMGYPLGSNLGGQATVTKGVLSARRQDGNTQYLQIDAAINPGNSGGPLLNSQGEVIGINTLKIGQIAGTTIESLGFAIAINSVKTILPSLKAGQIVSAPTTGWNTTYWNAAWGYSIRVAPGWTVDDVETDVVAIRSPGQLVLIYGVTTARTLNSFTDYIINYRRSGATSFTEISRSRVMLPGSVPAYSIQCIATLPGDPAPSQYRTIITVVGNRGFEVVAVTWVSNWERYGPTLEQMALSFTPNP
jgi:S1-C subfamily serine protease